MKILIVFIVFSSLLFSQTGASQVSYRTNNTGPLSNVQVALDRINGTTTRLVNEDLTSIGDSITYGVAATEQDVVNTACLSNYPLGYAQKLAYDVGGVFCNYGVSSYMAVDAEMNKVYPNINPGLTGNPTFTVMLGINDAQSGNYGSNSDKQQNYVQAMSSTSAWLAIPRTSKVFGQDAACASSGSWTADNTLLSGLGIASHTNGNTLTCSIVTTGGPVYVNPLQADGNGGTMNVSIDGVSKGTILDYGYNGSAILTQLGATSMVGFYRYPVSAGTHTVVFTVSSATGAGNVATVEWIGTPAAILQSTGPVLFLAGVTYEQNDANSSNTAAFNILAQGIASTLLGDRLQVTFVPVRNYINSTTDMANLLHPNDTGHLKLLAAFEAYMQPIAKAARTNWFNPAYFAISSAGIALQGSSGGSNNINLISGSGNTGISDLTVGKFSPNSALHVKSSSNFATIKVESTVGGAQFEWRNPSAHFMDAYLSGSDLRWDNGSLRGAFQATGQLLWGGCSSPSGGAFALDICGSLSGGTARFLDTVTGITNVLIKAGSSQAAVDMIDVVNAAGSTTDLVSASGFWRSSATVASPASGDACSPPQVRVDGAYIYVCVAPNTWRRSATSSY